MRREAKSREIEISPQRGRAQLDSSLLSPLASPVVKRLGRVDYLPTWRAMQDFTAARTTDTPDEIWLLQHPPVYTLGVASKP